MSGNGKPLLFHRPSLLAAAITGVCVYGIGTAALGDGVTAAWLAETEPSVRYPRLSDFFLHYWPAAERVVQGLRPTEAFQYPPLALVSFVFLAEVASRDVAALIWVSILAVSAGAIVAAPLPPMWHPGRWRALAAVLVLSSTPTWHCVRWGQISLPLTALAIWGSTRAATRWGPWLFSASIGLKLYPVILAAALLSPIRARVGWYLVALLTLMCGIPLVVLGPDYAFQATETALRTLSDASNTWMTQNSNAQFLPDVLTRPWRGAGRSVVVVISAATGLWCAIQAAKAATAGQRWLALATTWLIIPLLVPPAWPHYFVFLPWVLLILILVDAPLLPWHRALWGVSAVMSSMLGPVLVGGWRVFAFSGVLAVCNLLLLAVCISRIRQMRSVDENQRQQHCHQNR